MNTCLNYLVHNQIKIETNGYWFTLEVNDSGWHIASIRAGISPNMLQINQICQAVSGAISLWASNNNQFADLTFKEFLANVLLE